MTSTFASTVTLPLPPAGVNAYTGMTGQTGITRQQIRHHALTQRRQLSFYQQKTAEKAICRQVRRLPAYRTARTIAFYLSTASEAGTDRLLSMALRDGKHCFVPVLHPFQKHKMLFVRYDGRECLLPNQWGIKEPALKAKHCIKPAQLDLVMMPLVAFDREGHRLGMGKGYYDRAFAFRCQSTGKPFLSGLAHECQLSGQLLPVAAWDVDLDAVITANRIRNFRANRSAPLR